jgi:hypothetical protein
MRIDEIFGLDAFRRPRPQPQQIPPTAPAETALPRIRTISELQQWASSQGVELEVVVTPSRIELHDIGRVSGAKGTGAAVMRALCQLADERHLPIALEALDDNPARIAYFRRFGFAPSPNQPKIEDAGTLMLRPVTTTTPAMAHA